VPVAAAAARTTLNRAACPSLRSVRLAVCFTISPSLVAPDGVSERRLREGCAPAVGDRLG
jgi:hypothetical protein